MKNFILMSGEGAWAQSYGVTNHEDVHAAHPQAD